MAKKKFKHRDNFMSKKELREAVRIGKNSMQYWMARHEESEKRLETLTLDVRRLNQKVISDAFLIDELKKQIAMQHIQLCNRKEDFRDQQTRKLARPIVWEPPSGPSSAIPERTLGVGSPSPVVPGDSENAPEWQAYPGA